MKNTEIKSTVKCLVRDQNYKFYMIVNFLLKTFFILQLV